MLCNTARGLKVETYTSVDLEQQILSMKNWFGIYACLWEQLGLLEVWGMQLLY